MRGFSAYAREVLFKFYSFVYYFDDTSATVPWSVYTLRLSSTVTTETGNNFYELQDATSPGYARYVFPNETMVATHDALDGYRVYFYFHWSSSIIFPKAEETWEPVLQLCFFGIDGAIGVTPGPTDFIAGHDFRNPLVIEKSSQLVLLRDQIRFYIDNKYNRV